jgi:DNA-damage-inducible protein J
MRPAAKTTNYNIRLDPVIKAKAEATYADFGLNLSEAINVFLHMSIHSRGFPFDVRNPRMKTETLQAIQEAEQIAVEHKMGLRLSGLHTDAKSLFATMDAEDAAEDV